jgi:Dyp-type peroxidase family
MAPAAVSGLELGDVQGLVARGYGTLKAARFLLLGLDEADAARSWLGAILETVTPGDEHPEGRAVNVAFTGEGLGRLGLPAEVLAQFPNELVTGMTTEHRRRILGDLGPDSPEHWDWGGPASPAVGAVLLLYARDDLELARLVGEQSAALADSGIRVLRQLETSDLDGFEPFGFRDGISQPIVEGLSKRGPPGQTVKAGEFVLGYENEHGRFTDEPLLEVAGGIGRNGTYLVLRQLRQDVTGFWRFLDGVTPDEEARLRLAAKMVGRWPGGASLTLSPDTDDHALAEENDFGYHVDDAEGARCPIGSHVRRANPRDSLDPRPGTDRSLAINRRHRILRRGREYGQLLTPNEALAAAPAEEERERGLHFICLNANIARQFEFVQHTWANNPKFAGLYDDADPLSGPSQPFGGTFTAQSNGLRTRLTRVPRFISVKGGAYFFLPGLRALHTLSERGQTPL